MSLLQVAGLNVSYPAGDGMIRAVRDLTFVLDAGGSLGIAGESGSGKSQTALAIMGLLPGNATIEGSVRLDDEELIGQCEETLCRLRGSKMAMVFQDPMTALNPYMSVGRQIGEVLELHQKMNAKTAADRSCELLQMVGIENATRRISSYPHEFSGGQRQRVMIAIALACRPRLLIADEPTTALDVTVQKQILELLGSLCEELGTGLLMISHDLAVLSGLCGNLIIMYAGMTMESGRTRSVLSRARHPYTRALLETLAGLHGDEGRLPVIPGEPPDFLHPPNGCPFHPRCRHAFEPCDKVDPSYRFSSDSDEATAGYAACHLEQRL